MTFVFPILLGGLALAGIPIALHFIVRQKPRTLPFPAFRFLVQKQRTNLRKLRLRHFLLLALRVLLIAAMCLALARPRLFYEGLNLSSDRPVAAVLVFDTSASMDYKSGAQTRLDEAKQRGLELLDKLPEGCRLLVLDSADVLHERAEEPWLKTPDEARKRIAALKVRLANAPVTRTLEQALRRFAQSGRDGADPQAQQLLRFLWVFTDRTRGCWEGQRLEAMQERTDQVPPLYEGLQQARTQLSSLQDLLGELRERLPPTAKDYSDKALLEALGPLQEELRGVTPTELPSNETLGGSVRKVRRLARDLLRQTEPSAAADKDASEEYRTKLRGALNNVLRDLAGVQVLFVDVGVEQPVDLALLGMELPRDYRGQIQQTFGAGEKWVLQALVQAIGKEGDNTLLCQLDGKKYPPRSFKVAAGQKEIVPLLDASVLGALPAGPHQIEVRFESSADALAFNNQTYLTFAIRAKPRVLVLADETKRAAEATRALDVLGFDADLQAVEPKELPKLAGYQAVYLVGVAAPTAELWRALADFVRQGGGLAIVPPGDALQPAAYNQGPAQKLMPGTFGAKVTAKEPGAAWNWNAERGQYQHPFLQTFGVWKDDPKTDFILYPRGAVYYWDVKPYDARAVLMRYQDDKKRPAILERRMEPGQGKVLLFTTSLDERQPAWNNYDAKITSFYLALMWQSSRYLCGQDEGQPLNFTLGRDEPTIVLPPGERFPRYALAGAELFDKLNAGDKGILTFKELAEPGNYLLEGRNPDRNRRQVIAGFSVNVSAEENDLTRVSEGEIEQLGGPGSVIAPGRHAELRQALGGHWSEPLEIFPWLLILLLFALALENLLANKFYRQPAAES
jgi:hypothetical protein